MRQQFPPYMTREHSDFLLVLTQLNIDGRDKGIQQRKNEISFDLNAQTVNACQKHKINQFDVARLKIHDKIVRKRPSCTSLDGVWVCIVTF